MKHFGLATERVEHSVAGGAITRQADVSDGNGDRKTVRDYQFYETPETFTRYLFRGTRDHGHRISGNCVEPRASGLKPSCAPRRPARRGVQRESHGDAPALEGGCIISGRRTMSETHVYLRALWLAQRSGGLNDDAAGDDVAHIGTRQTKRQRYALTARGCACLEPR